MKHKGLTLIELIIVMAIFAIFSLAVYNYQSGELNVYRKLSVQTTLQGDAKNAVEQITLDIKKSRLTPDSVKTNYVDNNTADVDVNGVSVSTRQLRVGKFQGLLGSSYTPVVYIDFLNANTDTHGNNYNSCMYAVKELPDGTSQLVKVFLYSNEFTLDTTVTNITDGYNSANYNNKFDSTKVASLLTTLKTKPIGWSDGDVKFVYEEQGNYYIVCGVGNINTVYSQYNLKQDSSDVKNIGTPLSGATTNGVDEQVIVNNLDSFQVKSTDLDGSGALLADSPNNSFNISISLSKNITLNGKTTSLVKSFNSNATRLRYDGGDENAGN